MVQETPLSPEDITADSLLLIARSETEPYDMNLALPLGVVVEEGDSIEHPL